MKTKLVSVVGKPAILVDRELVEKLGINDDDELEVVVEDQCLVIGKPGALERRRPGRRGARRTQPGIPLRPGLPDPPSPSPDPEPGPDPEYGFPKKQPW
jgi:hypothetical protein